MADLKEPMENLPEKGKDRRHRRIALCPLVEYDPGIPGILRQHWRSCMATWVKRVKPPTKVDGIAGTNDSFRVTGAAVLLQRTKRAHARNVRSKRSLAGRGAPR